MLRPANCPYAIMNKNNDIDGWIDWSEVCSITDADGRKMLLAAGSCVTVVDERTITHHDWLD